MTPLLIFYYDIIDDYVFCEIKGKCKLRHEFYYYSEHHLGFKFYTYFSPNMQFICEVI